MPVTSGTTTSNTYSSSGSTSSTSTGSKSSGPGGGSLQAPNRTDNSKGSSNTSSGSIGSKGGGASTQKPGAGGNAGTVSKAATTSKSSTPAKPAPNTTTVNRSITPTGTRSYQEQTKINQMRDQYSEYGRAYNTVQAPPDPRKTTTTSVKVVDPSRSSSSVADARARSGDVAPSRATPQQSAQIAQSTRNAITTNGIRNKVDTFLKSGPPDMQRSAPGKTSKPAAVANNGILGPREGIYGPYNPNNSFQRDWAEKTLTGRTLNALTGGALTSGGIVTPAPRNGSATDTAWAGGPSNPAKPAPGKGDLSRPNYGQALADSLQRNYERDLADAAMGVNRPQYSVPGVSHFSQPMMSGTPDQQLMDRIVGDPTASFPAGRTAERTITNVLNNTPVLKTVTDRVPPEPQRIGTRSNLYAEQAGPPRPLPSVPMPISPTIAASGMSFTPSLPRQPAPAPAPALAQAAGTPTASYNANTGVTNPFYRDADARRQAIVNQIAMARGQAVPASAPPPAAPIPAAPRQPTEINVPGGGLPVAPGLGYGGFDPNSPVQQAAIDRGLSETVMNMATTPTGPIGAQGGLGVQAYPGAVNTPPMNVPASSSTQQRDAIYNGNPLDVADTPVAPSQEGDYPPDENFTQNDGQPQSLRELRNRYEYEKQRTKDSLRSLPGRLWDAITSGDIRNPGFPPGADTKGTPQNDPYLELIDQLTAELNRYRTAARRPATAILPGNQNQLDLVLRTFV